MVPCDRPRSRSDDRKRQRSPVRRPKKKKCHVSNKFSAKRQRSKRPVPVCVPPPPPPPVPEPSGIPTDCCAALIPAALIATFRPGPTCPVLDGRTFEMNWQPAIERWVGSMVVAGGTVTWELWCDEFGSTIEDFRLEGSPPSCTRFVYVVVPPSTCSPFYLEVQMSLSPITCTLFFEPGCAFTDYRLEIEPA